MIFDDLPPLKNRTAIFLPDDGALLAMAEYGTDALEWLFLPRIQVVMTDAVCHELLRERAPNEDDYAPDQRPRLARWIEGNPTRLSVVPTERPAAFSQFEWDWSDGPRATGAIRAFKALPLVSKERALVLANHDATRAALRSLASDGVTLTGTMRFFGMIAGEYRIPKALDIVSRDFSHA
jgi:hypothetical protein